MPTITRRTVVLTVLALIASVAKIRNAHADRAFHLRLVRSEPAVGDTIVAPKVVRLWFSEKVVTSVTSLRLKDAQDREIALGKVTYTGQRDNPVEAAITGPLAAGRYIVSYKTASNDMHPVTGEIAFVVR